MAEQEEEFNYNIVEHLGMKFVISRTPTNDTLPRFIELWNREGVKNVVRVCGPNTYDAATCQQNGITVHEMEFRDGTNPTPELIARWLNLVNTVFPRKGQAPPEAGTAIAVHCVAGLGRAPMLVAIALIEHGMENLKAVEFLRSKRRKCINKTQLDFLLAYKPKHNCLIM